MRKSTFPFIVSLIIALAYAGPTFAAKRARTSSPPRSGQLDDNTLNEIRRLYRVLIDAENRHDLNAVRQFVWVSADALFVAKTATAAEGNWAGFWGMETVLQHLDDLYKAGPFHIEPDYPEEKVVALSRDVVQTYVPVTIRVAYAGQVPEPKPFLMILEWVRTPRGWRMATDIALPIPPVSHS
jgi:hypothetical protein